MGVGSSWRQIIKWCAAYAPVTAAAAGPPAQVPAVDATERVVGGSWPSDLRSWYLLADGAARTPAGYLLPGYRPLPLAEVRAHAQMWRRARDHLLAEVRSRPVSPLMAEFGPPGGDDTHDVDRLCAAPAGTPAGLFLPSFVPVAEDQSGADLFVDLRGGPRHGCVTEFLKGDADAHGPVWPSVTALLADVAEAMTAGATAGGRRPRARDGLLDWELDLTRGPEVQG